MNNLANITVIPCGEELGESAFLPPSHNLDMGPKKL